MSMGIAAEEFHGESMADAAFAENAQPVDSAGPPYAAPVSRANFLDLIDGCVRHLAAWLGGAVADDAPSAERARVQLWQWLHGGSAALEDGTPIDFALFDAAVQRAGERLPRRGLPGQDKVMQAAWLLAELTHAGTFAQIPVNVRAP